MTLKTPTWPRPEPVLALAHPTAGDELRLRVDAPVVLHLDPPSFAAEQYRTLAVQIEERVGLGSGGLGRTVAVTSAEEEAG